MGCGHETLRTVGDRLFCKICGEELPIEYLTNGQKGGKEAPEEEKQTKTQGRKRAAKKAELGGITHDQNCD